MSSEFPFLLLTIQGLYKCMAKPHSRKCLSNACFDKLTHNLDCCICRLVHRGSSFQIQVNCCRMSKWTSLPQICHYLRPSSHNSSTTQANTKLTEKRNVMKKKKKICQHHQYNHARLYLIRVVYIELVINLGFITQIMLYQTPVGTTFDIRYLASSLQWACYLDPSIYLHF